MIVTLGAAFLLNDDLAQYLEAMHRRVIDLSFLHREMADAASEEDRAELGKKFVTERKWLREQADVLEQKFKPFLRLDG